MFRTGHDVVGAVGTRTSGANLGGYGGVLFNGGAAGRHASRVDGRRTREGSHFYSWNGV